MKRFVFALAFLFTLVGLAQAQENSDQTKVFVGYTAASAPGDTLNGVNVQGQVKLFKLGLVRVDAAGDFAVFYPGFNINVYTFQGGPQVGIELFNRRLIPFGRVLFGAVTTMNSDATYSYIAGGGADVNVTKRTFVRAGYDRQFINNAGLSINRFTVGGGFRF